MPFKKSKKTMTLDEVLASVSYDDAELLIRFYNSLQFWQKSALKVTMRKQLKGEFGNAVAPQVEQKDECTSEETPCK